MPFTPRIRALLILLLLACAAMGAGLIVLGRQNSSEAAPAPTRPPKSTQPKSRTARGAGAETPSTVTGTFKWVFSPDVLRGTQLPAKSTWTQADKPLFLRHLAARGLTYAQWRARHALRPRAAGSTQQIDAAPKPAQQLPPAIQEALAAHHVVVVSLYDPDASLDDTALREAAAGAQLAGTTFVQVDVTKNEVDSLTTRYGVISDPAVLVLRPPGDLVFRIDGFADRDTVAQAAMSAAS